MSCLPSECDFVGNATDGTSVSVARADDAAYNWQYTLKMEQIQGLSQSKLKKYFIKLLQHNTCHYYFKYLQLYVQ